MKKAFFLLFLVSSTAWGTDLNGLVRGYNSLAKTYYPIDRVTVELGRMEAGNRWVRVAVGVTDQSGRYYIYGIAPGSYTIRVGSNTPMAVTVGGTPSQVVPDVVLLAPRLIYNQRRALTSY